MIANARITTTKYKAIEDNESTLTVNVLSTFLLNVLLLPKLRETAKKYTTTPHITVVGSVMHFFADDKEIRNIPTGQIFSTLNDPKIAKMSGRYNLSKLLVTQCVRELAAQISISSEKDQSKAFVTVNIVKPGWCKTPLFRDEGLGVRVPLAVIGRSSEQGSRVLVHGVIAGPETHGEYLSEGMIKQMSPFIRSEMGAKVQKVIWEELMGKLERIRPGIGRNL